MNSSDQMALAAVRNHLSEVVDSVEREQHRVVITRHGKPAAVVISVDELASLEETLDIVSDPQLLAQIRDGQADLAAGRSERLTEAELRERLRPS